MRSMVMAALVGVLLASPAAAQTQAEIEDSAQGAYEMAASFARCAGFWDFMSAVEQATDNPASAQNAHNIGNGSRLSAGYMLSMRHRLQRPDEPPRAYGSWDEFIEPLAEVTTTRMMAALEREDMEEVQREAVTCRAMGETAQEIVEQMRAEWAHEASAGVVAGMSFWPRRKRCSGTPWGGSPRSTKRGQDSKTQQV